jgi:hypothetical protein
MGNLHSIRKISFEDMQHAIIDNNYIIINTMPKDLQHCLIVNTISADMEESIINQLINNCKNKKIIIYGKNTNDEKVIKKYNQLFSFGFKDIHVYLGGMFEWLLLQDIYGTEEFPTTTMEKDILKYKPSRL